MTDDEPTAPAAPAFPELLPWQRETARAALAARATWPHALLLAGPRGYGKRALALHFARALLCEAPAPDGTACGHCAGCHLVAAGQHPDFHAVEPFKIDDDGDVKRLEQIPVDHIRRLSAWAQLSSHRGGAKVALIAPADRLHNAAANALLKTLEEPPPDTYLILVAHQAERLPATVRSRCRRMAAPRPDHALAIAWLRDKGVVTQPEVALAQAAGAPLAALAAARADWQDERRAWLNALAQPQSLAPQNLAQRIESAAKDEQRARLAGAIDWLIAWTADVASVNAGGTATRNPDYARPIGALASTVAKVPLFRYHRQLLRQRALVGHPLTIRLVVEALLIDYRTLFNAHDPGS